MNFKRLYLLLVLFPLVLACTKGDDPGSSVPPPPTPVTPDPGGDPGETHPWDANRGKVVRPQNGNGWTVTKIDDGITYYAFEGTDAVSKAKQRVFVTETDLNNTSYSVKLAYYSDRNIASRVFSSTNAIAVMNGGYERGSIWLTMAGVNKATIANDYITSGDYKVPQWKSEAAIYMDNDRDVRIEYTGKDMTLAQWRTTYAAKAKTEKYLMTSAPMLIDDFEPVGETYTQRHPVQYPKCSEDPNVHQGTTTNPRTALAKTEDNHLLFVVVDGRRDNISRGISASELTQFLVNNFNPQYAINLDGGGSSTMCVAGQGDPNTHVVNYPCNNRNADYTITIGSETIVWPKETHGPDHLGERAVPTFFYVVKK